MRELGINWIVNACENIEDQAAMMKDVGFETTFLQMENADLDRIFRACRSVGISFYYLHGPYARDGKSYINDMWDEQDGHMFSRLLSTVELCSRYEIPIMVSHVSSAVEKPPCVNPYGLERFGRLLDRARELGVTIAFENQRSVANLASIFEEFPDARFCWDTGHESAFGGGIEFMPIFGSRISAVHLQDNRLLHLNDIHLIPGDGLIDFSKVMNYLDSYKYDGPLMMELKKDTNPEYKDMPAEDFFTRAAENLKSVQKP